jgi:hypothetical protein
MVVEASLNHHLLCKLNQCPYSVFLKGCRSGHKYGENL